MALPKSQVTILDFEDSFVFNIASEIHALGLEVQVVSLENIERYLERLLTKSKSFCSHPTEVLIWGPGPGAPLDHPEILALLKQALKTRWIYHLGICLGHQFIWSVNGALIERAAHPSHGQNISFVVPNWDEVFDSDFIGTTQLVQRYNSLAVKLPTHEEVFTSDLLGEVKLSRVGDEIMAGLWDRGLSYQFHPESVGTTCPRRFFAPLLKIFYNKGDGSTKN